MKRNARWALIGGSIPAGLYVWFVFFPNMANHNPMVVLGLLVAAMLFFFGAVIGFLASMAINEQVPSKGAGTMKQLHSTDAPSTPQNYLLVLLGIIVLGALSWGVYEYGEHAEPQQASTATVAPQPVEPPAAEPQAPTLTDEEFRALVGAPREAFTNDGEANPNYHPCSMAYPCPQTRP